MADAKISALPTLVTPLATDFFASVSGGVTSLVTRSQIHTLSLTEHLNLPQEDDAVTPTLNFGAGLGWYANSTGQVSVAVANARQFGFTSTSLISKNGGMFMSRVGTATAPVFVVSSADQGTGIGRAGAQQLSLIAGSVEGIRISEVATDISIDMNGDVTVVDGFLRINDTGFGTFATQSIANDAYGISGTGITQYNLSGLGAVRLLGGTDLDIREGSTLTMRGATVGNTAVFQHDDTDFVTTFVGTADWDITGIQDLNLRAGVRQRLYSPNGTQYMQLQATDSYYGFVASAANIARWENFSTFDLRDGATLRVRDAGDTDWADFSHNGSAFLTDFTNTSLWNVLGVGTTTFNRQENAATELKIGEGTTPRGGSQSARLQMFAETIGVIYGSEIETSAIGMQFQGQGANPITYASFNLPTVNMNIGSANPTTLNIGEPTVIRGSHVGGTINMYAEAASAITRFSMFMSSNTGVIETSDGDIAMRPAGGQVTLQTGAGIRVQDATNAFTTTLSHVGDDAWMTSNSAVDFVYRLYTGKMDLQDGMAFRIRDALDTDWAEFSHDGTGFLTAFTNTAGWFVTGLDASDFDVDSHRFIVRSSVGVSSPPVSTDSPQVTMEFWDTETTPQLAAMGFGGNADFQIQNRIHGGRIILQQENAAGTLQNLFIGDPDGATTIYHEGTACVSTNDSGIVTRDNISSLNPTSGGAQDSKTIFQNAAGFGNAIIGFQNSADFKYENEVWDGGFLWEVKDSAGAAKTPLNMQDDQFDFAIDGTVNGDGFSFVDDRDMAISDVSNGIKLTANITGSNQARTYNALALEVNNTLANLNGTFLDLTANISGTQAFYKVMDYAITHGSPNGNPSLVSGSATSTDTWTTSRTLTQDRRLTTMPSTISVNFNQKVYSYYSDIQAATTDWNTADNASKTRFYGFYSNINQIDNAEVVSYGIYLANDVGNAAHYGVYQEQTGLSNYFAGSLGVGGLAVVAPAATIDSLGPVRIRDSVGTDWIETAHNGVSVIHTYENTVHVEHSGITGDHKFFDCGMTVEDRTGGQSILTLGGPTVRGNNSSDGKLLMFGENSGQKFAIAFNCTSANMQFSGDSSGGATPITNFRFNDLDVDVYTGRQFRIRGVTTANVMTMVHDDTDFNQSFANTTDWNVTGLTGSMVLDTTLKILTDINTATPPTTETVNRSIQFFDAENIDILSLIGYQGSNEFRMLNRMHGGNFLIAAEDAAGTQRSLFSGDPDGSTFLYHAGSTKVSTVSTGIRIRGAVDNALGGLVQTHIALETSAGSARAQIGFGNTTALEIENLNEGGAVAIHAVDSGSVEQELAVFDPAAGNTFNMPGAVNARTAKVVVSGNSGAVSGEPLFEINQATSNGNANVMDVIVNSASVFSIDNEGDVNALGSMIIGGSFILDKDAVTNYASFNNSGGNNGFLFYTNSVNDDRGRVSIGTGVDAVEVLGANLNHDHLTLRIDVDGAATYSEAGYLLRLERDVTNVTSANGGFMVIADDTLGQLLVIDELGNVGINDTPTTAERFIVTTTAVANAFWIKDSDGRCYFNTTTGGFEVNINDQLGFSSDSGLISGVTTIRVNGTSTGAMTMGTTNMRVGGDVANARVAILGQGAVGTPALGIKEGVGLDGQLLIQTQDTSGAAGWAVDWEGQRTTATSSGINRFGNRVFRTPSTADGDGVGLTWATENASGSIRDMAYIDVVYDDISADDMSLRIMVRPGTGDGDPTVEAMRITQVDEAILFSYEAAVGLTADVGSAQGNGVIKSSHNVYSTVANAGDAATLPAVFEVGTKVFVKNDGANSMDIFPASGDDAGAGTDTVVALANGVGTLFIATVANATWTQMF